MKLKTKIVFILLALMVVFVSGCMDGKKEVVLNEPGNISSYEFEVFQNQSYNQTLANTTTYYLLENKASVQVVNLAINKSKLEIYPSESLGGGSQDEPIKNFVLLVDPANQTAGNLETFKELSLRNKTSDVNYTLTQEINQTMRIINLEFEEPVTGFIAYTLETPKTQGFAFIKPDSEFIRVVLPPGYVTGNRIFGVARPEPFNESFDEKGRQTLLWISSKMGEREGTIQVRYYSESAPLLFLAAIVVLLFGVVLVLLRYSKSRKELEAVKGILELEKEYDKKQRRAKK